MTKAIDSPKSPDGWISVRDRLPESGHVLVWCTLWCTPGEIAIGRPVGARWDVEGTSVANRCVTHWMPLPAPPGAGARDVAEAAGQVSLAGIDAGPMSEWRELMKHGLVPRNADFVLVSDLPKIIAKHHARRALTGDAPSEPAPELPEGSEGQCVPLYQSPTFSPPSGTEKSDTAAPSGAPRGEQ